MPFNLDLKSFIIGALFAYYLLPWVIGKILSMTRKTSEA